MLNVWPDSSLRTRERVQKERYGMKDIAREILIQAGLTGVKQIFGNFHDGSSGYCALGVLGYDNGDYLNHALLDQKYGLIAPAFCPECGILAGMEFELIAHLNDSHEFDFLTIARKMPVSEEGG